MQHINIAFYYLRKQITSNSGITMKATTTDTWFAGSLIALYDRYTKSGRDPSILVNPNICFEYIRGHKMIFNTPWTQVNYVLIPVHMEGIDHWYLLVLDIHQRRLKMFNSLKGRVDRRFKKSLDPFTICLPLLLESMGFDQNRVDVNRNSPYFIGKKHNDPFDAVSVPKLPKQVEW